MSSQSSLDWLQRVRAPRVQIMCDVYRGGVPVEQELPFVLGILGDFSGTTARKPEPLEKRKFVYVTRDSFDAILAKMAPGAYVTVPNLLTAEGGELRVDLKFESMKDFEPGQVARQIEPVRKLLEARGYLRDLQTQVSRPNDLGGVIEQILKDPEKIRKLKEELARVPARANGAGAAIPLALPADATLLDAVLTTGTRTAGALNLFLKLMEPGSGRQSAALALAAWIGPDFRYHDADAREWILRRLAWDITRLDELLNRQVNAILHHPDFQQLEAAWRGLFYLLENSPRYDAVKVKLLNLTLQEMENDLLDALEFDQSVLFRRIYEDDYDMPGGEPISMVVGNFSFTNHPQHIDVLKVIGKIAAAAFAPFIAAADPMLLDLASFAELGNPPNLAATFEGPNYLKWRALRKMPDSRFVGLVLPRILLREPYRDNNHRADGFRFKEEAGLTGLDGYLWGNPVFAFAAVVVRSFAETGWLANIRGFRPGELSAGVVAGLPNCSFRTDSPGIAPRCSTDVIITDAIERDLGELGFIPLCWCQNTPYSAFHGCQSIQHPDVYSAQAATVNARMSAMLHYILCAARFAHRLKIMMRDRIGGYDTADDIQRFLNDWLMKYVDGSDMASDTHRSRYPLREAMVRVDEKPGQPGKYNADIYLRPQFQLDNLAGSIHLDTEMRSLSNR